MGTWSIAGQSETQVTSLGLWLSRTALQDWALSLWDPGSLWVEGARTDLTSQTPCWSEVFVGIEDSRYWKLGLRTPQSLHRPWCFLLVIFQFFRNFSTIWPPPCPLATNSHLSKLCLDWSPTPVPRTISVWWPWIKSALPSLNRCRWILFLYNMKKYTRPYSR